MWNWLNFNLQDETASRVESINKPLLKTSAAELQRESWRVDKMVTPLSN